VTARLTLGGRDGRKKMTKHEKKTLNGLLHEIVGFRDKRCLRCGNPKWQLSHIYPKGRYRRMEFEPENVKALCYACHLNWWHKNPIEAHEWLRLIYSKEKLDRLKLMSNTDQGRFDYKIHKLFLENIISKHASAKYA
jgi:5-methylcytosine-specific restriction endonuclease McrA